MFESLKGLFQPSIDTENPYRSPPLESAIHGRTGDRKLDSLLKDQYLNPTMKDIMSRYRQLYADLRQEGRGVPLVGRYHHHRVIAVNEILLHAKTKATDVAIFTGNSDALAANKETFAHLHDLSEAVNVKVVLLEANERSLWRRIVNALPKIEVHDAVFKGEQKPPMQSYILVGDSSYLMTSRTENIGPEESPLNYSKEIPLRVNFNDPQMVRTLTGIFEHFI